MEIIEYIQPELLVLIPALYLLGSAFKRSELIPDKLIPIYVGVIGVALASMYVIATCGFSLLGAFTGIVQGILCAGASVYFNQMTKQLSKDK